MPWLVTTHQLDCPCLLVPLQFLFNGNGTSEEEGRELELERDTEPKSPPPLAPSIAEDLGEAELNNRGQWSPLPLEPEEYDGEEPIAEEDDAAATAAIRRQVSLITPALIASSLLRGPCSYNSIYLASKLIDCHEMQICVFNTENRR